MPKRINGIHQGLDFTGCFFTATDWGKNYSGILRRKYYTAGDRIDKKFI